MCVEPSLGCRSGVARSTLLPNRYPMTTPANGVIAVKVFSKIAAPGPLGENKYNIDAKMRVVMIPTNNTCTYRILTISTSGEAFVVPITIAAKTKTTRTKPIPSNPATANAGGSIFDINSQKPTCPSVATPSAIYS